MLNRPGAFICTQTRHHGRPCDSLGLQLQKWLQLELSPACEKKSDKTILNLFNSQRFSVLGCDSQKTGLPVLLFEFASCYRVCGLWSDEVPLFRSFLLRPDFVLPSVECHKTRISDAIFLNVDFFASSGCKCTRTGG